MNCEEAKNAMTVRFFGKLDPDEREALEEHLRVCPDCARISGISESRREAFDLPDGPPQPDWERSWEVIAGRALDRRRDARLLGLPWKWAPVAASLLAVFILGYVFGRRIFVPSPGAAFSSGAPAAADLSSLGGYIDTAEAVVIDFLNRGEREEAPEVVELERKIYRSMLAETRLLQGLAATSRDDSLRSFLDEMESILLSLSNLDPGDRESADLLDRTIRGRAIRSKLRELSNMKAVI
jgi:hypothetical protein